MASRWRPRRSRCGWARNGRWNVGCEGNAPSLGLGDDRLHLRAVVGAHGLRADVAAGAELEQERGRRLLVGRLEDDQAVKCADGPVEGGDLGARLLRVLGELVGAPDGFPVRADSLLREIEKRNEADHWG